MKKLGFTLAEVLITLGIVGVIAAITLPSFTTDTKKQSYAKSLAVAVSDFETAMKNMIEREDVDNIKETQAWINCNGTLNPASSDTDIQNFVNDLNPYLQIDSFNKNSRSYRFLNSQFTYGLGGIKFKTKKGIEYAVTLSVANDNDIKTENEVLSNGVTYKEQVATVNIDVNGADQPNMVGRDLFFYDLGNDGTLYPQGSRDYNFYHNNNAVANDFANGCGGAFTSACGEYLRQNGYKMDY